ncbi:hypothetical protein AJ87_18370 [Rhizobium yanglingense]|nr:hypothetical protein AJ87_18370 [Rhizobium yanglingense]
MFVVFNLLQIKLGWNTRNKSTFHFDEHANIRETAGRRHGAFKVLAGVINCRYQGYSEYRGKASAEARRWRARAAS